MPTNIQFKTVLQLLLSVFLFSSTTYINSYMIPPFLLYKGLSGEEYEQIESIEMLGFIITGFILIQLINVVSSKKIIIASITTLIIGTLSVITINDYNLFRINFIIMASATFSYITVSIAQLIQSSSNQKHLTLTAVFVSWIMGYFVINSLAYLVQQFEPLLCALLYSIIIIIITLLHKESTTKNIILNSRFSFLVENTELQLLTGFMVTYVTLDILWYYEAFALVKGLALANKSLVKHYMFTSVFLFIIPVVWLLNKMNKYLANLLLIIMLLASFSLLPSFGVSLIGNISLIFIIGICLCAIFICNILILSDKFEAEDLKTSLLIYFTMCAIGMYAGALSSYISYGLVDKQGFLFSIFSVVGTFILYYFWYFIKHKLYKGNIKSLKTFE